MMLKKRDGCRHLFFGLRLESVVYIIFVVVVMRAVAEGIEVSGADKRTTDNVEVAVSFGGKASRWSDVVQNIRDIKAFVCCAG